MIKTFRHKGLKRFFINGTTDGIQPAHASRLGRQLKLLDSAKAPKDMDIPGWKLTH